MLDYAREFPEAPFGGDDISETSVGLVNATLDGESHRLAALCRRVDEGAPKDFTF